MPQRDKQEPLDKDHVNHAPAEAGGKGRRLNKGKSRYRRDDRRVRLPGREQIDVRDKDGVPQHVPKYKSVHVCNVAEKAVHHNDQRH